MMVMMTAATLAVSNDIIKKIEIEVSDPNIDDEPVLIYFKGNGYDLGGATEIVEIVNACCAILYCPEYLGYGYLRAS
jgi:hypothetical protein